MLERPNICYVFEKLGVQGCQTWRSQLSIPFSSSPQCKKSSLRHHFRRNSWKLGSQKLHVHAHFWCTCKFSFSPVFTTPMGIFGQKYPAVPHLLHPKNDHTFVKEWMKALDKTRILAPSDYFYHFSFPRYGRLKSKFLCERYSHCIFSSCPIFNKDQIYMELNSSDRETFTSIKSLIWTASAAVSLTFLLSIDLLSLDK